MMNQSVSVAEVDRSCLIEAVGKTFSRMLGELGLNQVAKKTSIFTAQMSIKTQVCTYLPNTYVQTKNSGEDINRLFE